MPTREEIAAVAAYNRQVARDAVNASRHSRDYEGLGLGVVGVLSLAFLAVVLNGVNNRAKHAATEARTAAVEECTADEAYRRFRIDSYTAQLSGRYNEPLPPIDRDGIRRVCEQNPDTDFWRLDNRE